MRRKIPLKDDALGMAIHQFHFKNDTNPVHVFLNGKEEPLMHPNLFFRTWHQMKKLEKIALSECHGEVLDMGAAAGCHSLILQRRKFMVTAMDNSALSCEVMKSRGIQKIAMGDLWNLKNQKFDTILLLMNGFGLSRRAEDLTEFLKHLKGLLHPGGQILGDSTDIRYYLAQNGLDQNTGTITKYFGDVTFRLEYKELQSDFFWTYPDKQKLEECARNAGLKFKIVFETKATEFLVQLS